MGHLGRETFPHLSEDTVDVLDIYLSAILIEDLHEPAHVGSLKMVGQIHIHVDRGHGLLGALAPVKDSYRVADVLNANLVDLNSSEVWLALNVFKLRQQVSLQPPWLPEGAAGCFWLSALQLSQPALPPDHTEKLQRVRLPGLLL